MKSETFSTDTMQYYAKWNKALFEYFFPLRIEDPLLFVDDALLNDIGSKIFSEEERGDDSWADFFLLYALFNKEQIEDFVKDLRVSYKGDIRSWNAVVSYLLDDVKKIDDIPSYFAIICAIMYVAQKKRSCP